jgi:hypothetical protein
MQASPEAPQLQLPLAQPVRGKLTPGRRNVEMVLEATSPGGTTVARETYKRAAATPEGEDAESRSRRLHAERSRLWRARARLSIQLQKQRTISMHELDVALDALDAPRFDEAACQLPQGRLNAYEKLQAAKYSCAQELVGFLEALTVEEVYAMYPSSERPEYRVSDAFARPEEHRCACGSSHRLQCLCDENALNTAILLERKQDGDNNTYGVDQNREYREAMRKWIADGANGEAPEMPSSFTNWWEGYGLEPWYGDPKHEKSMHLADRLLRAFPGILISESEHAMAVYRRVSAHELIMGNWESLGYR